MVDCSVRQLIDYPLRCETQSGALRGNALRLHLSVRSLWGQWGGAAHLQTEYVLKMNNFRNGNGVFWTSISERRVVLLTSGRHARTIFGQHHPICQNGHKKNCGDSVLAQEMGMYISSSDIVGLIKCTLCGGHDRGIALRRDKKLQTLLNLRLPRQSSPHCPP